MESIPSRVSQTPVLDRGAPDEKREEIRRYFHATCDLEERLYDSVASEGAFYLRPEPLRHPLIFYLGHTASFYVNKLLAAQLIEQRVDSRLEAMFAIGVDEMSWDDLNEANYDWPTLDGVKAYRAKVRSLVDEVIRATPLTMPIGWDQPFWVILMGIEHQRIHIETSSVIIRRLPIEEVRQLPLWAICMQAGDAPQNELLPVAAGRVVLGKPRNHRLYGWDNEYGRQEFDVQDHAASRYLVSNREYLGFVEDGGYEQAEHWTEEGWKWVGYAKARHPLFWVGDPRGFRLRTMAQIIDMPWDWPVEVNYLEAKAFCNWLARKTGRPIRLPTEAEWYRLRDLAEIPDQPDWPAAPGNVNLEHWASPCPVTRFAFGEFYDVIGNVWQWTETPIAGFPGFEVHPYYDDFSTPTFDTQHNLIKGGSWISTGNEATRDSRYAFRRHFFQHAGFRYVASDQPLPQPEATYETDGAVSQYCEAHFGKTYYDVPTFAVRCAEACVRYTQGRPRKSAIDLGCAVGRASFELARHFEQVTGIDYSARFIRIGLQLKERGHVRYELVAEGEIVSHHEARLAEMGLGQVADRVEFFQGDATNLKPQFTGYDLILAANLIDRLSDPGRFVDTIHERLNLGGVLVITSPYTWLPEFTKRENWLGGFRAHGEPYTTLQALSERLGRHFVPIDAPQNVEFVIRETRRKFQHTMAELTAWERVR